jgi:hypothetical protein
VVHQHRVAVGLGGRDLAGSERAASSLDVLHDNLLAERLAHRLGDQARYGVGRAAGRERHDEGDRAVGVILRETGRCHGRDRDCCEQQAFHQIPPIRVWLGTVTPDARKRQPFRLPG